MNVLQNFKTFVTLLGKRSVLASSIYRISCSGFILLSLFTTQDLVPLVFGPNLLLFKAGLFLQTVLRIPYDMQKMMRLNKTWNSLPR